MKHLFVYILVFYTCLGNLNSHHPDSAQEANKPYPTIFISVYEDSYDGYNIKLLIENFKYSPNKLANAFTENEGYAIIYINDIPIGRTYSDWIHIPSRFFNQELNILKVSIKSLSHQDLIVDHEIISKEIIVENYINEIE